MHTGFEAFQRNMASTYPQVAARACLFVALLFCLYFFFSPSLDPVSSLLCVYARGPSLPLSVWAVCLLPSCLACVFRLDPALSLHMSTRRSWCAGMMMWVCYTVTDGRVWTTRSQVTGLHQPPRDTPPRDMPQRRWLHRCLDLSLQ